MPWVTSPNAQDSRHSASLKGVGVRSNESLKSGDAAQLQGIAEKAEQGLALPGVGGGQQSASRIGNLGQITRCKKCNDFFVGFSDCCDDCVPKTDAQSGQNNVAIALEEKEVFCRLYIFIGSARGLANLEGEDHRSDPFCVCTVGGRKALRAQTEVVTDCLNPVWNKEVRFRGVGSKDKLCFEIFDQDEANGTIGGSLGKAEIPRDEWFPDGFSGTKNLERVGGGSNMPGVLAVKAQTTFPHFVNVAVSYARRVHEAGHEEEAFVGLPGGRTGMYCIVRLLTPGAQPAEFRTPVTTVEQPVWPHGGQFPAVYVEDSPFLEFELMQETNDQQQGRSTRHQATLAAPGSAAAPPHAVSLGKAWRQVTDEGFEGEVAVKCEASSEVVGFLSVQVVLAEANDAAGQMSMQKSLSAAMTGQFLISRNTPHPDNKTSMPGGLEVTRKEAVDSLITILGGDDRVRLCILGGTKFYGKDSEAIVVGLAALLAQQIPEADIAYVTGGMPGIQEAFAKNCGAGNNIFNLQCVGEASNYKVGEDMQAGADMPERREVFGYLGDIYITVEGGPGVAQEAGFAHARGAAVVPLMRTGAASAGGFGFPAEALNAPEFAAEGEWELLRDTEAPVEDTVKAAASLIKGFVASVQKHRAVSTALKGSRKTLGAAS